MIPTFEALTGRTESHLIKITINDYQLLINPRIEKDLQDWEKIGLENGIDFAVASAFRSFDRQLLIWNEKVQGKRPVRNRNGEIIDTSQLNQQQLLDSILIWSNIPGVSRHHWGTDLDVFDAAWFKLQQEKLELQNSLFLNQGPCAKFHLLNEKLCKKNMPFYRPYNTQNSFMIELWHYSHAQVAKEFEVNYSLDIFVRNLKSSPQLELQTLLLANPEYYYQKYVTLC